MSDIVQDLSVSAFERRDFVQFFPADTWEEGFCFLENGEISPDFISFEWKFSEPENFSLGNLFVCFSRESGNWFGWIECDYDRKPDTSFLVESTIQIKALISHAKFISSLLDEFDDVINEVRLNQP